MVNSEQIFLRNFQKSKKNSNYHRPTINHPVLKFVERIEV